MAISGLLMVIALAGFSAVRAQAQFSDSVERVKEMMLARRTEALATIKLSGGADASTVTFGRLLTFSPNSSVVTVQTLSTANDPAPVANQQVNVVSAETTTFTIPWNVRYGGNQSRQVAFVRSTVDGELLTAVSGPNGWGNPPYRYSDFSAANPNPFAMLFTDGTRQATVTVEPRNDGIVRDRY